MKRKKSRHKVVAVHFLSNISLDGNHSTNPHFNEQLILNRKAHVPCKTADAVPNTGEIRPFLQHVTVKYGVISNYASGGDEFTCNSQNPVISQLHVETYHESSDLSFKHDFVCSAYSHIRCSTDEGNATSLFGAKSSEESQSIFSLDKHTIRSSTCRRRASLSANKRYAVCAFGVCASTIAAVYSIIPFVGRRTMATTAAGPSLNKQVHRNSTTHASSSNCARNLDPYMKQVLPTDGNVFVDSQLPIRPTGDAVYSYAHLLHHHRSHRRHPPNSRQHHESINSLNVEISVKSASTSPVSSRRKHPSESDCSFSGSGGVPMNRLLKAPAAQHCARQKLSAVEGLAASTIVDPLVNYLPNLLDDPTLLVATGKRVLRLPSSITSVLGYVRPEEQKRTVNQIFQQRFPAIQLTLTKLRSLKVDLVQITRKMSLDLWIVAHSHVLYEKLILKLFVNKANRKAHAAACLLISAKLNDTKQSELTQLTQELETTFRLSRRELYHSELEVFVGLEFNLVPPDAEIVPHLLRVHKTLDLAPPPILANFAHMGPS